MCRKSLTLVLRFVSVSFTTADGTGHYLTHRWGHTLGKKRSSCRRKTASLKSWRLWGHLAEGKWDYVQADHTLIGRPGAALPSLWIPILALPFLSPFRGSLELLGLFFNHLNLLVIWLQAGFLVLGRSVEQIRSSSDLCRNLLMWQETLNCVICVLEITKGCLGSQKNKCVYTIYTINYIIMEILSLYCLGAH